MQDPQVEVGFAGEKEPGGSGLGFTLGGEVDVLPPGEEVEIVPRRASVAQQNEIKHLSSVVLGPKSAQVAPAKNP